MRIAPSCSSSGAPKRRSPFALRSRNTGFRVTTWFVAGEYLWTGTSCTIALLRRSRRARPPSSNCGPVGAANPAIPPQTIFRKEVVAVLVVDEVALVQLPDELFASGGPLVEPTRAPAHAMNMTVDPVPHHPSDVVADPEGLFDRKAAGVDPIDDRIRVRPVLGDRHPQPPAVEVDPTRVIHVALAERDVGEQRPGGVDDEEVADSTTRRAVVPVAGHRAGLCRFDDLDRRDEEAVAELDHALRMLGVELQVDRADVLPLRGASDLRQRGCDRVVLRSPGRGTHGDLRDEDGYEQTDRHN